MSDEEPQTYLRRCNGQPPAGIPISERGLDIVLAGSKDVQRHENGRISWTSSGRQFTADPADAGNLRPARTP